MLTNVLFFVMAVMVSIYVILPIVQARTGALRKTSHKGNHRAADLEDRKNSIYSAIKEIEFDYQMGKLSEEDYDELRQQYKNDAVGLMKQLDKVAPKAAVGKKGTRQAAGKKSNGAVEFCWLCGTNVTADDHFCPQCGNTLGEVSN